jgi:hypothetical protein
MYYLPVPILILDAENECLERMYLLEAEGYSFERVVDRVAEVLSRSSLRGERIARDNQLELL